VTVNVTFDTHAFVKRLISVGFTEEQAEVLAKERSHLIQERFATKQDVESLRLEIQRDLRELEYRMVIKRGGMVVIAVIAAVVALVKLL
jgi:hypothetical protein